MTYVSDIISRALQESQEQTPCELFIKEIAEVTNRAESTVTKWVVGLAVPDINVRKKLSEHFGIPVDILFPKVRKRHEKQ